MLDPCGSEPGYKRIVACFIERLMMNQNSWSATVRGYAESVNTLFRLRNLPAPADLSDRTNMCARSKDHPCEREGRGYREATKSNNKRNEIGRAHV